MHLISILAEINALSLPSRFNKLPLFTHFSHISSYLKSHICLSKFNEVVLLVNRRPFVTTGINFSYEMLNVTAKGVYFLKSCTNK